MSARRHGTGATRRLMIVIGACVVVAIALMWALAGPRSDGTTTRVVIPRGASMRVAADSLAAKRIVRSPLLFRIYARLKERDRAIKSGTYQLRRGAPYGELVDALVSGRGMVRVITVVEGWELRQIVAQLARTLGVPQDSVEVAVRDTSLLRRLDIPTPTLEGYLFPATYTFHDGTTARQAVASMVARFEEAWQPGWDAQLQSLALSRHQAVTLASIVEREAKRPEERPVIAAVYYNRLRKGMRLQADPTVQYALGHHVSRVLYKDLEVESPYNTYRVSGLPPGPIGSPGAPSLEAAVAPAKVPFLYFVAEPDGHHEFRTTLAEHEQAVRLARRMRDSVARAESSHTAARPTSRTQ
jgi:UPF0755 protein